MQILYVVVFKYKQNEKIPYLIIELCIVDYYDLNHDTTIHRCGWFKQKNENENTTTVFWWNDIM